MEIEGKRILITGGARRIGRDLALGLADDGAQVVVHYNTSSEDKESLAAALGKRGQFFQADFRSDGEVEELIDQIRRSGRVDVLINNASIFFPTTTREESLAAWDDLFQLHGKVPYMLASSLGSDMVEREGGKIINLGDIYGVYPRKDHTPYCMSKAATLMLTRCLARELAPHVQVNTVSPGAILMPIDGDLAARQKVLERVPLARVGDPGDILEAVRLCIRSDYLTGQDIQVDGGRTINL